MAYQNHSKGVEKVSFKYKHGLMLLVKKNHQQKKKKISASSIN
jgi:hypothetical protein